jgi:hypothetical protein
MFIDAILVFFSNYLIEVMAGLLVVALVARFQAYRVSKRDKIYFFTLTREIIVTIEKEKEQKVKIDNVENYISDLMGRVSKKIPNRALRMEKRDQAEKKENIISLQEYVGGKTGFLSNIQSEASVFHCQTPPNFTELTHRLLGQDEKWNKLIGPIPLEGVSRMIDILPGLFIVFGVFGTFVGISMALPVIAQIDFNNLETSGSTLTEFVLNTTFAMKTSIAGIFFSVILTMLNTFSPIKDVRGRIFKQVETTMHALWYHVQQGRDDSNKAENQLERLVNILEKMYLTQESSHDKKDKVG